MELLKDRPDGSCPYADTDAVQNLPETEGHWEPVCLGRLASHELAPELVREVVRLFMRYVEEVVMCHALCPFLKDLESSLGTLCVVLDDERHIEACAAAVRDAESPIVHIVFPLLVAPPGDFERFGSAVNNALRGQMDEVPVHATFHPELAGARDDPHRLIGLLRQAPDPFLQFIPRNIQTAGIKVAGGTPAIANTDRIFQNLSGEVLDVTLANLADIRADRMRSYARFRSAFGLPALLKSPAT